MEKKYRTLVKSISWRVTATFATIVISHFVTGNIKVALSIGAVEFSAKILLYYFHERLWEKIKFGRFTPRDDFQI